MNPIPPTLREVYLTPTPERLGVRMYDSTPTIHAPEPTGLTAKSTIAPIFGNHEPREEFSMYLPEPASGVPWESWEIEGEFYRQKGRLLASDRASPDIQFARRNDTLAGDVEAVPVEVCAKVLHDNTESVMGEALPGFLVQPEFTSKVVVPLNGHPPRPNVKYYNVLKMEDLDRQIQLRLDNLDGNREQIDWIQAASDQGIKEEYGSVPDEIKAYV